MLGNDKNLHQYWSTNLNSYIPYSPLSFMHFKLHSTNLTPVLTTPKILITAREYYVCPDLVGMPYIYITDREIMVWTRLAMIDSYNTHDLAN